MHPAQVSVCSYRNPNHDPNFNPNRNPHCNPNRNPLEADAALTMMRHCQPVEGRAGDCGYHALGFAAQEVAARRAELSALVRTYTPNAYLPQEDAHRSRLAEDIATERWMDHATLQIATVAHHSVFEGEGTVFEGEGTVFTDCHEVKRGRAAQPSK